MIYRHLHYATEGFLICDEVVEMVDILYREPEKGVFTVFQ